MRKNNFIVLIYNHTYSIYLFVLFCLFIFSMNAYSQQTRQNLEEQRKQVLREIEQTNRLLRETVKDQEQSVLKLNLLNAQVTQYNSLISSMNTEIAYINRQISTTSASIRQFENDIDRMKTEYAKMVKQAYKNRGQYNKLIYVLSAKDFNEAYRRMKYFQRYSSYNKRQVEEIKLKQKELNEAIEQLKMHRTDSEKLLAEQRRENVKLQAIKQELDIEIGKLKSQERRLKTQLAEQQQRDKKIQDEIAKMISEEARKQGTTTENLHERLTPEQRLISNNFQANRGKLPWPIERGVITGKFGTRRHNIYQDIQVDNIGIYITTIANAEVRAVFDGEVTNVGGVPGVKLFVLVRHGNYFTVYLNLVDVNVKQGDKITLKQAIGRVYTEREAQSAVLQFQIYEGSNKQNPEQWLSKM